MKKIIQYVFEGTLFAIITRSLIVGANLSDALIIVGIIAAISFKSSLNKEKELKIEAVENDILKLSNKIDLITMKLGIVDARKQF